MQVKGKTIKFDWDGANTSKSYFKHGVTPNESEEMFIDSELLIIPDIEHSSTEKRFIAVGKSLKKRVLFIAFTMRNRKIRVISARRMHKKEVEKYGKIRKSKKV